MGLPGKTIDKAWRNDADTVAEFFNTYHRLLFPLLSLLLLFFNLLFLPLKATTTSSITLLECPMIIQNLKGRWLSVGGQIIDLLGWSS